MGCEANPKEPEEVKGSVWTPPVQEGGHAKKGPQKGPERIFNLLGARAPDHLADGGVWTTPSGRCCFLTSNPGRRRSGLALTQDEGAVGIGGHLEAEGLQDEALPQGVGEVLL